MFTGYDFEQWSQKMQELIYVDDISAAGITSHTVKKKVSPSTLDKDVESTTKGVGFTSVSKNNSDTFNFDHIQYLLHPANKLSVRLTHRERAGPEVPRFDVQVIFTTITIKLVFM